MIIYYDDFRELKCGVTLFLYIHPLEKFVFPVTFFLSFFFIESLKKSAARPIVFIDWCEGPVLYQPNRF